MVDGMELKGPLVMASGKALRKNGGYGSFLGPGLASGEFAQIIKRYALEGINQVKVLVSGIVSFKEYGRVGSVQFDLKELSQIVQIAGIMALRLWPMPVLMRRFDCASKQGFTLLSMAIL